MIHCGIYKITNLIDGKIYIGQSKDIVRRWKDEKSAAKCINDESYDTALSRALRKYGVDNFEFSILEECDVLKLNEREGYWAEYYNSYVPNGYNMAKCGEQSFTFRKLDFEILQNIIEDLRATEILEKDLAIKYNVSLDTISKINVGVRCRIDSEDYPIRKRTTKYLCIDCGKPIDHHAIRCVECAKKAMRKVERPSPEELAKEVLESGFCATGRKYGVTDNTVRKWLIAYNWPTKKEAIKLKLDNLN